MKKELFGQLQGQDIFKYTLQNDHISISILNYGGIIQHLMCPDKYGQMDNVVLSYDDFESYKENPSYFGCMIGRCAGRTESFKLNDIDYELTKNKGIHMHGGEAGFDKKIWEEELHTEDTLILSYESKDMEECYPGTVKVTVTYRINRNSLHTGIKAVSDQETVINVTNHSYFNLSGCQLSGTEQILKINSDYIMELDEHLLPTGKIISVQGTPFDFREGKKINKDINKDHPQLKLCGGYDHPFVMNGKSIVLQDEVSRREMTITTNQSVCILYSGNHLSPQPLSKGILCQKHLGICLETQAPPNGVNIPVYKNLVVLKAKQNYSQENTWTFSLY